jgi:hypothetical protein
LSQCNLREYFDDVQIQHVPRYAYGEQIAVLHEETNDRFSLTLSYQRFASRLLHGSTPWEAALIPNQPETDSAQDISDPGASRRLAIEAYRQRIKAPVERLNRSVRLAEFIFRALITIGTVVVLQFLREALYQRDWFTSSLAVAALASIVAAVWLAMILMRWRTKASRVSAELSAFEQNAPPYDEDNALDRLRDKLDPLLAEEVRAPRRTARKVYISYRRSDTAHIAVRLVDRLRSLGKDIDVVVDLLDLEPGDSWSVKLRRAISSADVMLVLIGRNWSGLRAGERQLDQPYDFVKLEIAGALASGKVVIPVLVDGASMPGVGELPAELRELTDRQAVVLQPSSFDVGVERLYKTIQRLK